MRVSPQRIERTVEELIGDVTLHPGQEDAIRAALQRDVLAVLATGTGKSLIYRVVGELLGGLTLVVSPTIALQTDQLAALEAAGPPAAVLNSALSASAQRRVLGELPELGFLLLSPEQLARQDVLEALAAVDVRMVAVDEAHCVTAWGHDFRPDYLALAGVVERLGRPRVLALTATASSQMRAEIVQALRMRDPMIVVGEVDRPNIWLGARTLADDHAVTVACLELLGERHPGGRNGAAIVYAATRRRTETLAAELTAAGIPAAYYHGSMAGREREETHEAFLSGAVPVVVATSAFGLGVDKPDVRTVVHVDPAEDLDAYYQQVGRAGRDGEPAVAMLLSHPAAYGVQRYFASGRDADGRDVTGLLAALGDGPRRMRALATAAGLTPQRARRSVNALVAVGGVREGRDGVGRVSDAADTDLVAAALAAAERRRARATTGVELMRRFAETDDCRRRLVLQLLGEDIRDPCGHCDNCEAGTASPATDVPFRVGERVTHPEWGAGVVQQYEEDRVVVLFDGVGFKTLAVGLVTAHHLLADASVSSTGEGRAGSS